MVANLSKFQDGYYINKCIFGLNIWLLNFLNFSFYGVKHDENKKYILPNISKDAWKQERVDNLKRAGKTNIDTEKRDCEIIIAK